MLASVDALDFVRSARILFLGLACMDSFVTVSHIAKASKGSCRFLSNFHNYRDDLRQVDPIMLMKMRRGMAIVSLAALEIPARSTLLRGSSFEASSFERTREACGGGRVPMDLISNRADGLEQG